MNGTDVRFNLDDALKVLQHEREHAIAAVEYRHEQLVDQLRAAHEVGRDGIPTLASATAAVVVDFENPTTPVSDLRLSFGPNDWGQGPVRLANALPVGKWRAIVLVTPRSGT